MSAKSRRSDIEPNQFRFFGKRPFSPRKLITKSILSTNSCLGARPPKQRNRSGFSDACIQTGKSGNPKGRPKGSRNELGTSSRLIERANIFAAVVVSYCRVGQGVLGPSDGMPSPFRGSPDPCGAHGNGTVVPWAGMRRFLPVGDSAILAHTSDPSGCVCTVPPTCSQALASTLDTAVEVFDFAEFQSFCWAKPLPAKTSKKANERLEISFSFMESKLQMNPTW